MLTYFHDTNDIFIMCDGLDKLGGPTSVTGIAVKVFVTKTACFAHCEGFKQLFKQCTVDCLCKSDKKQPGTAAHVTY